MKYPRLLQEIMDLMQSLSEDERRENLVLYADQALAQEPREGEVFDLEDVRKDEECTDTVGLFLKVDEVGRAFFRVKLGPQVQTLTRAMASILCQGLNGSTPREVLEVTQDFVPKIIGSELVRLRSQTVYYILTRMKSTCKVYLNQRREESIFKETT